MAGMVFPVLKKKNVGRLELSIQLLDSQNYLCIEPDITRRTLFYFNFLIF